METKEPLGASNTNKFTPSPEEKSLAGRIAPVQRIPEDVALNFVLSKGKLSGSKFDAKYTEQLSASRNI